MINAIKRNAYKYPSFGGILTMRPSILFKYRPSVSPKEYKKYMHNMINAININVTIIKHLKPIANIYKNNANKKNFLLNLINIIVNG